MIEFASDGDRLYKGNQEFGVTGFRFIVKQNARNTIQDHFRKMCRHLAIFFCMIGATSISSIVMSVSADAAPPTPAGTEYFEKHIRALLVTHCYECHSIRSGEREGGLLLDSRAGWSVGGDNGPAIIPGKVDASLLIQAVRHTNTKLKMPPKQSLPARSVARLERWVKMGAPDPRDKTKAAEIRRGNPSDPISGRNHWSFRPLKVSTPPRTVLASWPRTGVDSFVLARLERAKLRRAVCHNILEFSARGLAT